jgi:hypothetical protein
MGKLGHGLWDEELTFGASCGRACRVSVESCEDRENHAGFNSRFTAFWVVSCGKVVEDGAASGGENQAK